MVERTESSTERFGAPADASAWRLWRRFSTWRTSVPALRRAARWRRTAGLMLLFVPALLVLSEDWWRRGARLSHLGSHYHWTYFGSFVEALFVWGTLLYAATRRRGAMRRVSAVAFVVFFTFAVGGQTYFYEQYNAYLNVDVSVFASNFMDSVVNQLFADLPNYLEAKTPILVAAAALLWLGSRVVRPRRRPGRVASIVAPLLLVASFFIPTQHRQQQAAMPDMLYMQAVGGLLRTQAGLTEQSNQERPRVRNSLPVAHMTKKPPVRRNVLFIILESVRADSVCVDYDPLCKKTEFSNALTKKRYPLHQMRSLDSSTAISLAVLWAGIGPNESREVLHTWPLIFDYARAAGWDTAFWTSQNMMFGNARLWVKNLGVSHFCSATDLDPTADLDMGAPEHFLADRVNAEIGELTEPYLAVIQLSNVHYPYYVEADGPQPFQPATTSKAPDVNYAFKNYYQNAVYQQDRHVASILRHLRSTEAGKRTVVVYTSDHAEAFREHGQMGHTFSTFDEEVKVPAWVDAPDGTLTREEAKNLAAKTDEFNFHPDLTATIIDLMGLWDEPALDRYKTKMLGSSLLREPVNLRKLPMTNCAGVWSCAFENWGVMQRNMKLGARSWDEGWQCFDVAADPFEKHDLGAAACKDLMPVALSTFKRLPGRKED